MTPYLDAGEAYADPGQITLGMLADMGYAVPGAHRLALHRPSTPSACSTRASAPARRTGAGRPGPERSTCRSPDARASRRAPRRSSSTSPASPPTAQTDVRVYPTPVTVGPVPVVSNLNLVPRVDPRQPRHGADRQPRAGCGCATARLGAPASPTSPGGTRPAAATTFRAVDPVRLLDTRRTRRRSAGRAAARPAGRRHRPGPGRRDRRRADRHRRGRHGADRRARLPRRRRRRPPSRW